MDMCESSLKNHYADVLHSAVKESNADVVETLLTMATSGQHPAVSMFWAKTRMGWRETNNLDHSGEIKINWVDPVARDADD